MSLNFLAMIHLDGHVTNINTVEQTSFTVVSILMSIYIGSCNPIDLSQNMTECFERRLFEGMSKMQFGSADSFRSRMQRLRYRKGEFDSCS